VLTVSEKSGSIAGAAKPPKKPAFVKALDSRTKDMKIPLGLADDGEEDHAFHERMIGDPKTKSFTALTEGKCTGSRRLSTFDCWQQLTRLSLGEYSIEILGWKLEAVQWIECTQTNTRGYK
jgi:hypothetical protein